MQQATVDNAVSDSASRFSIVATWAHRAHIVMLWARSDLESTQLTGSPTLDRTGQGLGCWDCRDRHMMADSFHVPHVARAVLNCTRRAM